MTVWLVIGGKKQRVELGGTLGGGAVGGVMEGAGECLVDGRAMSVDVRLLEPGVMSLLITSSEGEGRQYRCVLDGDGVVIGGRRYGFEVEDPRSLQGRRGAGAGTDGPRPVKAPMPGRVVRLLVEAGESVDEGQGVVVIEAMKMQNELKSPKGGRVVRVGVAVGDTVGSGDVLVVVE
ncbi:MAG: biotin/lipoyl attachment domain protein [Edaphobacter sp.]|nr:biotin/lipoyl attachment domain protein [Edaphobacter sp.]